MMKIKVLSPFNDSLARVDLDISEREISGGVYLTQDFEFAPVYAYRYGHPYEVVGVGTDEYNYPNMSYGSRVSDTSFRVDFRRVVDFRGVNLEVSVGVLDYYTQDNGGVVVRVNPLSNFIDVAEIEKNIANTLSGIFEHLKSPDELYKMINEKGGYLVA